jgi:hypothetical protein
MGGRKQHSAVDTALLLTDFVERNKAKGLETSVVFLDVKGAFGHVAKNRLLKTMTNLRLPDSIVRWTQSFLEDRTIRLAFDGQIDTAEVVTARSEAFGCSSAWSVIERDTSGWRKRRPHGRLLRPALVYTACRLLLHDRSSN